MYRWSLDESVDFGLSNIISLINILLVYFASWFLYIFPAYPRHSTLSTSFHSSPHSCKTLFCLLCICSPTTIQQSKLRNRVKTECTHTSHELWKEAISSLAYQQFGIMLEVFREKKEPSPSINWNVKFFNVNISCLMLYKFKDWTFPFQKEKTIEGLKLADWNDINVISSHHHHRRIKSRHCTVSTHEDI